MGGLFEAASGGTLLLDEIGDLPLRAQAKILMAVETGRIRRLGSGPMTMLPSVRTPSTSKIASSTRAARPRTWASKRMIRKRPIVGDRAYSKLPSSTYVRRSQARH
jgi:transcriptional regulator with AAA-type ATPase domain